MDRILSVETRNLRCSFKTKCRIFLLALMTILLSACSQNSSQGEAKVSTDKLSMPIPRALSAIVVDSTNLVVEVRIVGGAIIDCGNLVVDTNNATYTCSATLPVGNYSIILVHSIIDPTFGTVRVTTLSGISVNVIANIETAADLTSATLTLIDDDNDNIPNISELAAGTNPADVGATVRSGYKIDFNGFVGSLANDYGAASGQIGPWNYINTRTNAAALTDVFGTTKPLSISLNGSDNYITQGSTEDDVLLLNGSIVNLNITAFIPFSFSVSGLENGVYDIYYYYRGTVTGMTITNKQNEIPITNLTGSVINALLKRGANWEVVSITITDGTLIIKDDGNGSEGLSGLQIVPR